MSKYNGPQEQAGCGHHGATWPGAAVIIPGPACLSVNKAFYGDERGCAPASPTMPGTAGLLSEVSPFSPHPSDILCGNHLSLCLAS